MFTFNNLSTKEERFQRQGSIICCDFSDIKKASPKMNRNSRNPAADNFFGVLVLKQIKSLSLPYHPLPFQRLNETAPL